MSDFEAEFARRNALSHALAMAHCLLHDNFLEMRDTAEASLIRHLPTMQPRDRIWVTPVEIRALASALNPQRPALTLALLGALGQVGDKKALRSVIELQRDLEMQTGPEAGALRMASAECIARLHELAALAKQSQALLRPSSVPASDARSTLLRPAHEAAATASRELLRSGEAPGETRADEPTLKDGIDGIGRENCDASPF